MTTPIQSNPSNIIDWIPSDSSQPIEESDLPKAIYTPETETAPQGRIIDDSARGTIFWEALGDEDAQDSNVKSEKVDDDDDSSNKTTVAVANSWRRPFRVQWISTSRVPFYRTRGLRNQLNANREVKIARDGTELEEGVGKRLLQMFHKNNPGPISPTTLGSHSTGGPAYVVSSPATRRGVSDIPN
jgi:YT521-B-like domain